MKATAITMIDMDITNMNSVNCSSNRVVDTLIDVRNELGDDAGSAPAIALVDSTITRFARQYNCSANEVTDAFLDIRSAIAAELAPVG